MFQWKDKLSVSSSKQIEEELPTGYAFYKTQIEKFVDMHIAKS